MRNGDVHKLMEDGIRKSNVFLCCLSTEYAKSANCKAELKFAGKIQFYFHLAGHKVIHTHCEEL